MKKVAIMQPYFFPFLGHFSLIKQTDQFIILDEVQFIRHGWIERNRILKQNDGWLYIKVPLQTHSREALIKDIGIDNSQSWVRTILEQMVIYKKIAPNYNAVRSLLESVLNQTHKDIVSLDLAGLQAVCNYLQILTPISIFSEMDLKIEPAQHADEWALNICQALGGVNEYWNPPGGQAFFDKTKYDQAGIQLKFHKIKIEPYDQRRSPFEPGLSIIDVMMFNPVDKINKMMDNYELG